MNRLTDRNYKNTTLPLESCQPYLKLGKLEDLEEQIGCPLEVYTKLVYDTPVYDLNGNKGFVQTVKKYEVDARIRVKRYVVDVIYFSNEKGAKDVVRGFPLEHYKKTWWLKADRSE